VSSAGESSVVDRRAASKRNDTVVHAGALAVRTSARAMAQARSAQRSSLPWLPRATVTLAWVDAPSHRASAQATCSKLGDFAAAALANAPL